MGSDKPIRLLISPPPSKHKHLNPPPLKYFDPSLSARDSGAFASDRPVLTFPPLLPHRHLLFPHFSSDRHFLTSLNQVVLSLNRGTFLLTCPIRLSNTIEDWGTRREKTCRLFFCLNSVSVKLTSGKQCLVFSCYQQKCTKARSHPSLPHFFWSKQLLPLLFWHSTLRMSSFPFPTMTKCSFYVVIITAKTWCQDHSFS